MAMQLRRRRVFWILKNRQTLPELADTLRRLDRARRKAAVIAVVVFGCADRATLRAWHNPPIVLRRSLDRSKVVPLEAGCIPVGIFEDSQYSFEIFQLEIGDVLVAYTDGITESENLTGDHFGRERLERILCG
jgi:hypothetical protein